MKAKQVARVQGSGSGNASDTGPAARSPLTFTNRQRDRRLNLPFLRRVLRHLLAPRSRRGKEGERLRSEASTSSPRRLPAGAYDLCFHFVTAVEMARVNWQFLQHEGSTDVITFDYVATEARWRTYWADDEFHLLASAAPPLHGEAFICVAEAVKQAREFKTSWQSEVVRYAVHAVLHLSGYDDLQPAKRRVMKREENRLVRALAKRFDFEELEKRSACG